MMCISLKFHALDDTDWDKPSLHYPARGKPPRFSLRPVKRSQKEKEAWTLEDTDR